MVAPAVIAGGIWAYRAYRLWRAAQAIAATQAVPAATAGVLVGGGYLASEAISGAEEDAQATPVPTTDVCTTCPPPGCGELVEGMRRKNEALKKELNKYDPVSDAAGGHQYMVGGVLRTTVPGGHYREIRDLQRGLKNDLERYNRMRCYQNAPASDRITRDAAQQGVNQPIEIPPGQSFIPL